MLTFNLNEAPPTLAEMGKVLSRLERNMVLGLILVVLMLIVYAPSIVPDLKPYMGYHSWAVFLLRLILTLVTTMFVILKVGPGSNAKNLVPISKENCFEIAKGLDQPLIATYCARVAAQGRELVAGEYDAIIQQIQIKAPNNHVTKQCSEASL